MYFDLYPFMFYDLSCDGVDPLRWKTCFLFFYFFIIFYYFLSFFPRFFINSGMGCMGRRDGTNRGLATCKGDNRAKGGGTGCGREMFSFVGLGSKLGGILRGLEKKRQLEGRREKNGGEADQRTRRGGEHLGVSGGKKKRVFEDEHILNGEETFRYWLFYTIHPHYIILHIFIKWFSGSHLLFGYIIALLSLSSSPGIHFKDKSGYGSSYATDHGAHLFQHEMVPIC